MLSTGQAWRRNTAPYSQETAKLCEELLEQLFSERGFQNPSSKIPKIHSKWKLLTWSTDLLIEALGLELDDVGLNKSCRWFLPMLGFENCCAGGRWDEKMLAPTDHEILRHTKSFLEHLLCVGYCANYLACITAGNLHNLDKHIITLILQMKKNESVGWSLIDIVLRPLESRIMRPLVTEKKGENGFEKICKSSIIE